YNFASLPRVEERHPLWSKPELGQSIAAGEHSLPAADHGRRETWGSDPLTGKIREIIHLPGNSWLPFVAALILAVVCISLLAKAYPLAILASLAAAVVLLRWSWENGAHPKAAPDAKTQPGDPPLHSRTCDGPGLWGMAVTLLANAALYLALLFGWFYLWTVAPDWIPVEQPLATGPLLASVLLLSLACAWQKRVLGRLRHGAADGLFRNLAGLALCGLLQSALLLWTLLQAELAPRATAHDALIAVFLGYGLLHCLLASLLTALQAARVRYGYVGAHAPYEPLVVGQLWYYNLGVLWSTFCALVLFPMSWGGL